MNRASFATGDVTSEIIVQQSGKLGVIILNRAKSLNALSLSMIDAIQAALESFAQTDAIKAVWIEGAGRAFCAGGDIVSLYNWHRAPQAPNRADPAIYFAKEYALNVYIRNYPKPYIAFLDGFVMGGGAGLSLHGKYRIATKNMRFAMPEAMIGFFTDAGAKMFLAHLPEPLALYICLSGDHFFWGDCLELGLATHAIDIDDAVRLKQDLAVNEDIESLLGRYNIPKASIANEISPARYRELSHYFSADSVEQIMERIKASGDERLYRALSDVSAFSLKIIFYYMRHYDPAKYSMAEIMEIERKLAIKMLKEPDFYEGVRALLIDKDKQPKWQFRDISAINDQAIAHFFASL